MKISKIPGALFIFIFALGLVAAVKAEEFSSDNFIIRDPVIRESGGRSTSTSFELFDITSQIQEGESTSTGFLQRAGFLYFPIANIPSATATPGDGQVVLTWTASTGVLANVTNYEVGISTTAGGPYTFESVGNVLTFTKTGLTNGTTYYFVIRSLAGTLVLAKSTEASAAPNGAAPAPAPSGGGGIVSILKRLIPEPEPARILKLTDFNGDGQVDIADFSIMLFYFDKPAAIASRYDLNSDGRIDIVDVSILLYYWTS